MSNETRDGVVAALKKSADENKAQIQARYVMMKNVIMEVSSAKTKDAKLRACRRFKQRLDTVERWADTLATSGDQGLYATAKRGVVAVAGAAGRNPPTSKAAKRKTTAKPVVVSTVSATESPVNTSVTATSVPPAVLADDPIEDIVNGRIVSTIADVACAAIRSGKFSSVESAVQAIVNKSRIGRLGLVGDYVVSRSAPNVG